jgi:hypothetical protein
MNQIEVGARVHKENQEDGIWFIVPLCQKHESQRGEVLIVNDNVKLVSTQISETCGSR